jgi:hypothetical protein
MIMFGWIKTLFGVQQETKPTLEVYTPPRAKTQQKTTAKKSAAAKSANTGRKQGAKKAGVTKTDLNKMSKDQLESYAKKEFKVDIDKRKKKADLVEEVLKLVKKNA